MTAIELQPRPLYSIGTVSRLTGVKSDTLRVWERRYELGASCKTASGRRQYTQTDLEHLQLVAALIGNGARIGDIASADRRTLEVLLRQRNGALGDPVPQSKPRILFVGEALCDWIDEHQGCLMNVSALLARTTPQALLDGELDEIADIDGAVFACPHGVNGDLPALRNLAARIGTSNVMVLHPAGSAAALAALELDGALAGQFPPDPAQLTFYLSRCAAEKSADPGAGELQALVQPKERLFTEAELEALRQAPNDADCQCRAHIADILKALVAFEEYSANCASDDWRESAVHACVYAYTGQARWLMEKALSRVADNHRD
ncbi:MAG: MerR family transcriptional regulator [Halioglobus sp.]|nr:MerR family transcriptional regulator [Halioglobus sp.]